MKTYIIMLFVFLSSCGFHPRGVILGKNASDLNRIINTKFYIQDNNFYQYAHEMQKGLISHKADVVTNYKDADYIINIQNVAKKSQILSIVGGASNNTYQLIYIVTYSIFNPHDKNPILSNKTLSAQQSWQSNSSTAFSQNNEADRVYNYLQSQLVQNMVNQVALSLPNEKKQKWHKIRKNKF